MSAAMTINPDHASLVRHDYGRIETYMHSDAITHHKGAAMVRVICRSEAGSRTEPFRRFCKLVAQYAYASSATCWFDIVAAYPEMAKALNDAQTALREEIVVTRCVVMKI